MVLSNRSRLSYKLKFAARHPDQILPYIRRVCLAKGQFSQSCGLLPFGDEIQGNAESRERRRQQKP
jgi:hypothetical protein